jgi:hypothetical protein
MRSSFLLGLALALCSCGSPHAPVTAAPSSVAPASTTPPHASTDSPARPILGRVIRLRRDEQTHTYVQLCEPGAVPELPPAGAPTPLGSIHFGNGGHTMGIGSADYTAIAAGPPPLPTITLFGSVVCVARVVRELEVTASIRYWSAHPDGDENHRLLEIEPCAGLVIDDAVMATFAAGGVPIDARTIGDSNVTTSPAADAAAAFVRARSPDLPAEAIEDSTTSALSLVPDAFVVRMNIYDDENGSSGFDFFVRGGQVSEEHIFGEASIGGHVIVLRDDVDGGQMVSLDGWHCGCLP